MTGHPHNSALRGPALDGSVTSPLPPQEGTLMQRTRVIAALAVAAAGTALAVPSSAVAAPSCVGQAAGGQNSYPTEVADFVTFFAGPGYGQNVSSYSHQDRGACPPLPVPGG
jgi:hypothetical protein